MSIDLEAYCDICGEDMVARLGDQPLCLTHFIEAIRQIGEER